MNKKIFCISLIILILIISGCGNSTIEDQIIKYSKDIQKEYGDVSIDYARAYSDGENQYIIVYFYGIKENHRLGDAYIIYTISNDGTEKTSSNLNDYGELSAQLISIIRMQLEEEHQILMDKTDAITYEEFKDFKEGYVKIDMTAVRDALKEK